jgi:DNA repair protein RecO (recombination protein O)
VLRTVPYGEADVVAHLLCRGLGRVGAFARGARRSSKRFGGGLELFTLLQVDLQPRRGGDLLEFRGATILKPHLDLRGDLGSLAHAGYATELCRELLHDHEPHDALLDLLLEFYALLGAAGPRSLTLRAFELGAMQRAGLAPHLGECARCGAPLDHEPMLGFDPNAGGLLCPRCFRPGMTRLDQAGRRLLLALQSGGLVAASQAKDDGLPLQAIEHVMRSFVDRHVHHDLKSRAFMHDVGAPP